jgi:hypothetical protein
LHVVQLPELAHQGFVHTTALNMVELGWGLNSV